MPISSSVPTGALSTAEPCFAQPQVPLKKKNYQAILLNLFQALRPSILFWLWWWSCWLSLPQSFIFGASLNEFRGAQQNRLRSKLLIFFVKDNQAIQLQAAALCASCGSASGKRSGTFRGRNTSVSFCSSFSKNTIFAKFTSWGISKTIHPPPTSSVHFNPNFFGAPGG